MLDTTEKNKIKPDTILKNFWRDNRHFADLFNAVFFNGEQVLKPQDLTEADTDVSSMLKFKWSCGNSTEDPGCCKEDGIWCGLCSLGTGKSGKRSIMRCRCAIWSEMRFLT